MDRRFAVVLAVLTLVGSSMVFADQAGAASARAAQCAKGSDPYAGKCFTVGHISHVVKVVEAVPLRNTSKRTVDAHCQFTQTISEGTQTSQEVSGGVKADLFDVISVDTSYHLTKSVSQTASQATAAGGSVKLKPGQHITCERTYGYVTTLVKVDEYQGDKSTRYSVTTRIPSYLGATFTN